MNEFYSDGVFDEDGDPTYCAGYSVRATEHSVMEQLGPKGERDIVRQILQVCPTGIIAMVGDTYNIFEFADMIGTEFHPIVCEREGVVVIRPDSGEPIPTMMKVNWHLGERFGYTVNSKGYRVFGKESDKSSRATRTTTTQCITCAVPTKAQSGRWTIWQPSAWAAHCFKRPHVTRRK